MSYWGNEKGAEVACPYCGSINELHRDMIGENVIACSRTQGGEGCGRVFGVLVERRTFYTVKTAKMGEYE
jgi:hypothetical protein